MQMMATVDDLPAPEERLRSVPCDIATTNLRMIRDPRL